MKLVWTASARVDRKEIRDYIARDDAAAALVLDEAFSAGAARLVDHPALGRPGRVAGTRELVVHRNYVLVYSVAGDIVVVIRLLHAARQWPPLRM